MHLLIERVARLIRSYILKTFYSLLSLRKLNEFFHIAMPFAWRRRNGTWVALLHNSAHIRFFHVAVHAFHLNGECDSMTFFFFLVSIYCTIPYQIGPNTIRRTFIQQQYMRICVHTYLHRIATFSLPLTQHTLHIILTFASSFSVLSLLFCFSLIILLPWSAISYAQMNEPYMKQWQMMKPSSMQRFCIRRAILVSWLYEYAFDSI